MVIEKIRNKAKTFWKHGKHAKIDPVLLHKNQRKRPKADMFASIRDLMRKRR